MAYIAGMDHYVETYAAGWAANAMDEIDHVARDAHVNRLKLWALVVASLEAHGTRPVSEIDVSGLIREQARKRDGC